MESIDTRILFPSETACVKPPAKQCRGSALHLDGTGRKASGGIHSGRKPLQGHGRGLLRDHLATLDDRGCGESPSPVSCDGKKPSASLPHACVQNLPSSGGDRQAKHRRPLCAIPGVHLPFVPMTAGFPAGRLAPLRRCPTSAGWSKPGCDVRKKPVYLPPETVRLLQRLKNE
jgi:hypothetical protein